MGKEWARLLLWFGSRKKPKVANNRDLVEQQRLFYRVFLAAAAFRIIAAHFVASASDSKPKTAEYFLPTTWATTKSMLMPASAMACAVAALKAKSPVSIEAAEAVDKSYPDFYRDLEEAGVVVTYN